MIELMVGHFLVYSDTRRKMGKNIRGGIGVSGNIFFTADTH